MSKRVTAQNLFESFWEGSANIPKKQIPTALYPKKIIKNREEFYAILRLETFEPESRNRPTRSSLTPPAYVLNCVLYWLTKIQFIRQVKYKITSKVWADVLGYCHIITNESLKRCRLYIGEGVESRHYIDLVTPNGNEVLTLPLQFTHTGYSKVSLLLSNEHRRKYQELQLGYSNLKPAQQSLKNDPKIKYFTDSKFAPTTTKERSMVLLSQDKDLSDVSISEEELEVEEQVEVRVNSVENNNNNNLLNITSFDNEADVSDFLPPAPDISSVSEAYDMQIDESVMDVNLVESINNDSVITSLIEPPSGTRNIHHISAETLSRVENGVLEDRLKERVREHHESNANAYDEDSFNQSFLNKLGREEQRAQYRARQGKTYTGTIRTGDVRENPGINPDAKPQRAFTNQDDDYLDYAFYGMVRESGTVVTEIMKLPLGYDYNSQRRGSSVYIRAIHFKNTFTHVSGSKAQGRMILFYTTKESSSGGVFGRSFNTVAPHDILQKSVTMYAGDIEELETIDLFYNPTILSPLDFRNVVLGNKYQVLWDYYAEMNTQAVKGVVGEDIESVDSVKTKWVKLDNLDIPLFYDGDDKIPTRGMLGILFMGDYFGGIVETNLVMRVYYNSK